MRKEIASTVKLDVRLTPEEKERIKVAAAAKGMSMSDFVRWACE